MNDAELLDRPGVRIIFRFPRGDGRPPIRREWTWREVFTHQAPGWLFREDPPYFLYSSHAEENVPEIEWHDPLLPIEYHGWIRSGLEDEAVNWVARADERRRA